MCISASECRVCVLLGNKRVFTATDGEPGDVMRTGGGSKELFCCF